MDPITDLPPPMTVDHAGDPSLQVTSQPAPHPPYAEMINSAISGLKDRDGSSRQAISKYIEKEYPNLPPTHSVMLTHHLKRLKNLGQLIMVKHSYMLPPPPRSTPNDINTNVVNPEDSGLSSKRKPGRPPKLKPVPALAQMPNVQPPLNGNANNNQPLPYQPQFPNNVGQDLQITDGSGLDFQGNSTAEPLFASLGLGDDGVVVPSSVPKENTPPVVAAAKRGRGRPPKSSGGGRPQKKRPGRPKSKVGGNDEGGIQGVVAGEGKGVGEGEGETQKVERPVKKQKMMSVMAGNGVRAKKGRGRPKRIGPVTVPLSGNLLMPRTRPKRVAKSVVAKSALAVNGGVGETISVSKRPASKFTGKRAGRPSKGGAGTAVIVTDPRQLVVYQELKSKYDLLQSKVKQVASMVRPCINPDFGKTALGALQELEALAGGVEVNNAPTHDQTQEPETEALP